MKAGVLDPLFDVIVPVHNSFHVARLCLSSLERTIGLSAVRVTCVLDACDEHTRQAVKQWAQVQQSARIIELHRNVGFVGACNNGIEAATGKFVVLVNSDTCATENWTKLFLDCFNSDTTIGIASPISNFCPHNSVPIPPSMTLKQMAAYAAERKPAYPDITTCEGFFFAIRRQVLDQIGFLDGIFGPGYCEESDLSLRANYFGWRTVLVDNCFIFHYGRESFGSATRQMQYDKNKRVFFDRWHVRYKRDFEAMKSTDSITTIRKSLVGNADLQPVKWVP